MLAYGISGACAALTGVYLVSRMGSGDPWRGDGFDLASITPVVVGGTALSGGRGGPRTLLGVYLISSFSNILNFLDVSTFYQWIVQGLIIIIAVAIYVDKGKRTRANRLPANFRETVQRTPFRPGNCSANTACSAS